MNKLDAEKTPGDAPKVGLANTIEIGGRHYYSQEYVDALLSETSGVGVLLDKEEEKEFDQWHMKLMTSNITGYTGSFGSCLLRDLIRDKKVKKMMRVVWYNNFIRQVEVEDD